MGNIFTSLGINWQTMIFQLIAFAVLIFLLAKFAYPPILAMLDRREKMIEESVANAKKMNEQSRHLDEEIDHKLADATARAQEIVSVAREQSQQIVLDGEEAANKRAEAIVAAAHNQLEQDVEAARKTLRADTVQLVAKATAQILHEKVTSAADQRLIREIVAEHASNDRGDDRA